MAFYNEEDEDDLSQQNGEQPVQLTNGQGSMITGTGGPQNTQAQSMPQSQSVSQKPDRASSFVGIQDYIKANQQQGSQLGDRVAGQVSNKIAQAQGAVGGLGDAFKQEADKGVIANIGQAGDDSKNIVGSAARGTQPLSQDQTNRFKEITTASYKGPQTLSQVQATQPAYQTIQQAQNYANLSKDEAGSQQLLKDLVQKPGYNAGESRLDAYLLNSSDNRAKLAQSRANADALNQSFTQAEADAAAYAKQLSDQTEALKSGAKSELETQRAARAAEIEALLGGLQKGWSKEYDDYVKLLNAGKGGNLSLTQDQMKKLNVDENERLFNLLDGKNAKDFLTLQAFDPNKLITKEEQAQLDALDQLANQYGGELTNKYTQADLAGTLTKENAFDGSRFGGAVDEAMALFDAGARTAEKKGSASSRRNVYEDRGNWINDLSNWLNPVKRWVTEREKIGTAEASNDAIGTVADYLAGKGPEIVGTGSSGRGEFGSTPNPLGTQGYSRQITEAVKQLEKENAKKAKAEWTKKIQDYLKTAGYGNQIKRV